MMEDLENYNNILNPQEASIQAWRSQVGEYSIV